MNLRPARLSLRAPAAAILGLLFASPAALADSEFEIVKATADKVWRLNKRTGEISICALEGTQLVCTPAGERAGGTVRVERSRVYYVAPIPWRPVLVAKPHRDFRAKHRK